MTDFSTDFQNFYRDIDRWMDRYGGTRTLSTGTVVRTGLMRGTEAVFDLYLANGAFDVLIDEYGSTDDWRGHDYFARIHDALVARTDVRRLKRLWGATLASQKSAFWEMHAFCRAKGPFYDADKDPAVLARNKARVLDTLAHVADLMDTLGDAEDALRLREEHGRFEREERVKLGKPIDRAMDEAAFWDLIESAAREAAAPQEAVDRLTQALQAYKPSEIRKFEKILRAQMAALQSWDVLALARLTLGGASDDTFEYFRAWMIFQGRDFCEAAQRDVESLAGRVRYGAGRIEVLPSVAPTAYENRAGKPLKPGKLGDRRLKGAAWEEADLAARYPRLCAAMAI